MKVLSLWHDTWYSWGKLREGAETAFFGNGLFEQLGCEEIHVALELVRDKPEAAVDIIRSAAPYDMTFIVPQHETLYWLKEIVGGPVVAWMTDDTWRHDTFCKSWVHACDLIATTDLDAHKDYERSGFRSILTNFACRPEWAEYSKGVERRPTAGFHGLLHGVRRKIIEEIRAAGSVPIVGSEWNVNGGVLTEADYHRLIGKSEFSICLTDSSSGAKQMKGRLFEPQVHGSILVTEPCPRLEEYWEPGAECVVFQDPAGAQNVMAGLLADRPRLDRMREAARKRALGEHTYAHRMRDIFATLDLKPGQARFTVTRKDEPASVLVAVPDIEPEIVMVSLASIKRSVPAGTEILIAPLRRNQDWLTAYAEHIGATLVYPPEKTLPSAMNSMLEVAANERILLIAHDVLVTSHAIKGALAADLDRAFWVPRVIDLESGTDLAGPASVVTVPYLLACRKADAIQCGGFDETYRAGIGYEGRDFAARLALMLGRFRGDWNRIVYRLPSNPPRQDYAEASERNRHVTMQKWGGMPFGGSPTAFTVRPEMDRSGRRAYLCEADAALIDKAMRMTESRFLNGETKA